MIEIIFVTGIWIFTIAAFISGIAFLCNMFSCDHPNSQELAMVAFVVFLGSAIALVSIAAAENRGKSIVYKQAVEAEAGYWSVDPKYGEKTFKFYTSENKEAENLGITN